MSAMAVADAAPVSPEGRAAHGRKAREWRPRSSLATWEPGIDRPDPVDILEQQARTRVASLVPIRYGRMAASPFAFYRGAAAVMASDLGRGPTSGLVVQLCGDAHLVNFGGFAAPDRRLVFGINDFDETHPGPFEWDVQRLVASFEIAARSLGMDEDDRVRSVRRVGRAYRKAMRDFAEWAELDVWNSRLDLDGLIAMIGPEVGKQVVRNIERSAKKAERKDRYRALRRLTETVDGQPRFVHDPPLIVPIEDLADDAEVPGAAVSAMIGTVLLNYRDTLPYRYRRLLEHYRYVHMARKVVGVGSVGTRAWVILLLGRDEDDPLILQGKEAQASVLEPYTQPSAFASHGERVVTGQGLIQAASDIFLGWTTVAAPDGVDRDFYVRQLWDWKASPQIESMDPTVLDAYANICGWTLARAHARTGDRIAIASYVGKSSKFDRALASFAAAYADQNDRDHAALRDAIASGRVRAEEGV